MMEIKPVPPALVQTEHRDWGDLWPLMAVHCVQTGSTETGGHLPTRLHQNRTDSFSIYLTFFKQTLLLLVGIFWPLTAVSVTAKCRVSLSVQWHLQWHHPLIKEAFWSCCLKWGFSLVSKAKTIIQQSNYSIKQAWQSITSSVTSLLRASAFCCNPIF